MKGKNRIDSVSACALKRFGAQACECQSVRESMIFSADSDFFYVMC